MASLSFSGYLIAKASYFLGGNAVGSILQD
jgi:hypothetical protein